MATTFCDTGDAGLGGTTAGESTGNIGDAGFMLGGGDDTCAAGEQDCGGTGDPATDWIPLSGDTFDTLQSRRM